MRQSKREVKDFDEIVKIMENCDVCRLAFNDGECPYILPLNFGMSVENGEITLYFHSALEGYKVELMNKNELVAFEMDCSHKLEYIEEQGYCTMCYESVMGKGRLRILPDDEKQKALSLIMEHYHLGENAYFSPDAIPRTLVYSLSVDSFTAKRKKPKLA